MPIFFMLLSCFREFSHEGTFHFAVQDVLPLSCSYHLYLVWLRQPLSVSYTHLDVYKRQVDAGHFFLENKVVAKSVNTIQTLQFRLLGNEEGKTSFFQAGDIPFEKMITSQVEVFLSVTLQILSLIHISGYWVNSFL